ncbi:acyl-CoA dehydrogenase [Mycolicibacterium vaccae]|uniref:Putative acyl-CoA dehydrogenase n=1 Tax=Mycolicibacterium vaccae ATCC 25954 TaxID=1194972 RepID=K0V037_MYCVA|nr:acyl-CoA dehydrogenase [Mycolicibacterium vaccae]ANI39002.1 acyl-CoA dehydrogenase [Mycolicibacterium vaccae 95051]EJZ12366.1 putative acyl-CoA dehydrogenase [Mycolicibacterium vaccae ATCC 25954]MCV7062544.1 acyl-CoA dehydrogenase [Mycolicibacterium vaccae]
MGIAITEDHRELAGVVRSFLQARNARSAARELLDAEAEARPAFWAELAGLGWLGLHIPEEYGGAGAGLPELVVVAEEFGRAVAPGPFVPTVVGSAVISVAGNGEQRTRWLPSLVDGSVTAGFGVASGVTAEGDRFSGEAGVVFGAGLADLLILTVGEDVVVVDATADGVTVDVPANLDPTRRSGRVTLTDVALTSGCVLPGAAAAAIALARTIAAAEAVGGAHDCVDAAVGYAKVREQFGRTIGTFQAVKHHLANMLVAAEQATATVWDAARAAESGEQAFTLMAAAAATLAFPAYVHNAELNIQVHGGIGFTWEHDAHLHLRRSVTMRGLVGGRDAPADVYTLTAKGVVRENSIDLPPAAEQLRADLRAELASWSELDDKQLRRRMIETGYVMAHWPKPWGRAADAVEQLVIEQEFAGAGVQRPEYGITGWVILTLIQHGTQDQIERFVNPALRHDQVWCQLFSEPGAGSDAAAVSTKAIRTDGGWLVTGQKVWTSNAQHCQLGLATVRTDPSAAKHAGITTVIIDMSAPGVEVRPLRQITGGSEFNEVFFNEVFVPDRDVVGQPNDGWTVARATLGNERVSIGGGAAGAHGAAGTIIDLTQRFGDRVAGAAERAGRFLAEDHALRLLNLRRAARSVAGAEPGPEGNVTKLLIAEHVVARAGLSAELFGADVALLSRPAKVAGLLVLGSRGMTIAGGTSEVTRNQIAERILGLPRDPLIK